MYTRDEMDTAGKPGDIQQVNNAPTLQAKKAHRGPGGVPLLILKLGDRYRSMISFKKGLFTPGRKTPTATEQEAGLIRDP
jgi:hypothetical protein